jgi:putative oxidoreductase
VLRIYTGLLLLEHGTAKILGFPAVASFAKVELGSLVGASGLIELMGGALFTIGLFTRPVAFILSGFAAVAYFMVSAPKWILSDPEQRRTRVSVQFCLYLFRFQRPGPVEPRRDAGPGARMIVGRNVRYNRSSGSRAKSSHAHRHCRRGITPG